MKRLIEFINRNVISWRVLLTLVLIHGSYKEAGLFTALSFFLIYLFMELTLFKAPYKPHKSNGIYISEKVFQFLKDCSEQKCPSCGSKNPATILTEEVAPFCFQYTTKCQCGYRVFLEANIQK